MRIVGMAVIGAGEADRWLDKTLACFSALCDDVVVALCNADEATKQAVYASGFYAYEDNREWGRYQPKIKTELLKYIGRYNPDWVLALDADEVLDETVTRGVLEEMAHREHYSYQFYVVNLWNDEAHYWKQGSFWNVRFFKYAPAFGLDFVNKNVHCGLAPPFFYQWAWFAPYILWHRGLMYERERRQKVDRYKKYDPKYDKIGMGQYYAALETTGRGTPLDVAYLRARVQEEVNRIKPRETVPMNKQDKKNVYHVMRRPKDGALISDIRDQDVKRRQDEGWEYIRKVGEPVTHAPTAQVDETPQTSEAPSRKRAAKKASKKAAKK